MRLLVTPSFVRASKKLHRLQKADPEIGEAKAGDHLDNLTGSQLKEIRRAFEE